MSYNGQESSGLYSGVSRLEKVSLNDNDHDIDVIDHSRSDSSKENVHPDTSLSSIFENSLTIHENLDSPYSEPPIKDGVIDFESDASQSEFSHSMSQTTHDHDQYNNDPTSNPNGYFTYSSNTKEPARTVFEDEYSQYEHESTAGTTNGHETDTETTTTASANISVNISSTESSPTETSTPTPTPAPRYYNHINKSKYTRPSSSRFIPKKPASQNSFRLKNITNKARSNSVPGPISLNMRSRPQSPRKSLTKISLDEDPSKDQIDIDKIDSKPPLPPPEPTPLRWKQPRAPETIGKSLRRLSLKPTFNESNDNNININDNKNATNNINNTNSDWDKMTTGFSIGDSKKIAELNNKIHGFQIQWKLMETILREALEEIGTNDTELKDKFVSRLTNIQIPSVESSPKPFEDDSALRDEISSLKSDLIKEKEKMDELMKTIHNQTQLLEESDISFELIDNIIDSLLSWQTDNHLPPNMQNLLGGNANDRLKWIKLCIKEKFNDYNQVVNDLLELGQRVNELEDSYKMNYNSNPDQNSNQRRYNYRPLTQQQRIITPPIQQQPQYIQVQSPAPTAPPPTTVQSQTLLTPAGIYPSTTNITYRHIYEDDTRKDDRGIRDLYIEFRNFRLQMESESSALREVKNLLSKELDKTSSLKSEKDLLKIQLNDQIKLNESRTSQIKILQEENNHFKNSNDNNRSLSLSLKTEYENNERELKLKIKTLKSEKENLREQLRISKENENELKMKIFSSSNNAQNNNNKYDDNQITNILKSQLDEKKDQIKELKLNLSTKTNKIEKLEETISQSNKQIKDLETNIKNLNININNEKSKFNNLLETNKLKVKLLNKKETEINDLTKKLNLAIEKQNQLIIERNKFKSLSDEGEAKTRKIENNFSNITTEIARLKILNESLLLRKQAYEEMLGRLDVQHKASIAFYESIVEKLQLVLDDDSVTTVMSKINLLVEMDVNDNDDDRFDLSFKISNYIISALDTVLSEHFSQVEELNMLKDTECENIEELKRQLDDQANEMDRLQQELELANEEIENQINISTTIENENEMAMTTDDEKMINSRTRLRIDDLNRRLKAEREARKYENDAAASKLAELECENENQEQKLREMDSENRALRQRLAAFGSGRTNSFSRTSSLRSVRSNR